MGLARRATTAQPQPAQNPGLYQEMAAIREQLKPLQEEVKVMRDSTIPKMDEKLSSLLTDLTETKEKIADFGDRFKTIERQKAKSAMDQAAGFNRIEALLGNMGAIWNASIAVSEINIIEQEYESTLSAGLEAAKYYLSKSVK
jgi:hypothetical protein